MSAVLHSAAISAVNLVRNNLPPLFRPLLLLPLVGWLVDWLVGWLVGWRKVCLAMRAGASMEMVS